MARRHLWNTISEVRDSGTSIVLTSHRYLDNREMDELSKLAKHSTAIK